ncbi:MAG: PHP domain-containing protein [Bacillota bacterium]
MRFDMHIHSIYSPDSDSSIENIYEEAKAKGLDGIAITDHNSFAGSKAAMEKGFKDFIIIPGAEYSTEMGHLLVYFLREGLEEKGLTRDKLGRFKSSDIIEAAHKQDAIVFIAHPFSRGQLPDTSILKQVDGIEAYNSRAAKWINTRCNLDAMDHALRFKKPISAGSDAHCICEIGNAFIDIDVNSSNLDDIKSALISERCTIYGKTSSSIHKVRSDYVKCKKSRKYNPLRLLIKLLFFSAAEAILKAGLSKAPEEGIYSFKNERIERNDFI